MILLIGETFGYQTLVGFGDPGGNRTAFRLAGYVSSPALNGTADGGGGGGQGECQPEAPALLITPMRYHWACASEPGAPRHSLALVPACSSARFTSATNEAVPFPLQATEAGTWASWAGCWLEGRGEEGALPLVETVICRPAGDPEPQPGWGKTSIWAVGG